MVRGVRLVKWRMLLDQTSWCVENNRSNHEYLSIIRDE